MASYQTRLPWHAQGAAAHLAKASCLRSHGIISSCVNTPLPASAPSPTSATLDLNARAAKSTSLVDIGETEAQGREGDFLSY